MSQSQSYIHLTNKEKASLQKIFTRFVIICIILVIFFPFSLIGLFFIKKIKNYFLSNKELLQIKAKLKEFSLKNSKKYQKNNGYGNQYKIEKDKEILENKEEKRNNQSSFYEQNKKNLQSKLQHQKKKSYTQSNINISNPKESKTLYSSTSKNNNFFGNNQKSKTFGNGKSIWDDYESVTDNFSSNKK